ncbi:unnamed protein product [Mytilus coruscus]|uniref:Uncharacterized protein n=1 Tax=Mytilus coruscus TaxID=42192 RepID=A0A6J8BZ33_MYTCO|nr:unnamed protein product [Mytilus coruscus]
MNSSELKKEIENFASAALEIKKSNNEDFSSNISIGIKLVRGAFTILSFLKGGLPVTTSAYLILSIGMAAFNMKEEPNIDNVAKDIIGQEKDQEMTNECEGAKLVFVSSTKFLCGIGVRKLATHEISSLSAHVSIDAGVNLLGKLMSIIVDLQNKTCQSNLDSRKTVQFNRLMKYVHMYCCLATLRKGVLLHMYTLLHISDNSPGIASGVKAVLDEQNAQDTSLLEFLTRPKKENAILSFLFDPIQYEIVEKFLGLREMKVNELKHLTEGKFTIRPLAYPTKRLYMANVPGSWILVSEKAETSQTIFRFHAKYYNTFTISSLKWPEYFIRMEMGGVWVAGKKGCPDGQADFKIVQIAEKHHGETCYLLAPTDMKTKLLYAASVGRVCGESCKPNDKQFWMIEKC